ncbi:MAG: tRNA (adenosine(37)-N6)-threonylcarbamoyltransferase complex ATPase subunit type 1 TsaE [Fuerstiella sp.]
MNSEFESHSAHETAQIGLRIAKAIQPGQVIALNGDLGSGKTALTKSICEALGIDGDTVNSPTFVLMQLYQSGSLRVAHFDTYRLADPDEFLAVGGEDYLLSDDHICLIEWAERIEELLPPDRLEILITQTAANSRMMSLHATGSQSIHLLQACLPAAEN